MPIACLTIVGDNPEPFLEAALRSVAWVDYYAIVNTAPDTAEGRENEGTARESVPAAKLRFAEYRSREFSFAEARNRALGLIDPDHFVVLVDADDVHYPELEPIVRHQVLEGADRIAATFWHLMVYKDLYQDVMKRDIVFRRYGETRFEGRVHERLAGPLHRRVEADYRYVHYGYIKPQSEVLRRWRRYGALEGDPHRYDRASPDSILDDRIDLSRRLPVPHPPAVEGRLAAYPSYFEPDRTA